VEVENSAYEGALTTPAVKESKSVPECKGWAGSRLCQPIGDSLQNLYIANKGIIEAGSVEENYTVAFEIWEMRNGDDICSAWFSGTGSCAIADFHLFFPDDIVDELRVRSVSDTRSFKSDLAHRTLSRASWTQNAKVNMR
jgi:hypothetical protein